MASLKRVFNFVYYLYFLGVRCPKVEDGISEYHPSPSKAGNVVRFRSGGIVYYVGKGGNLKQFMHPSKTESLKRALFRLYKLERAVSKQRQREQKLERLKREQNKIKAERKRSKKT